MTPDEETTELRRHFLDAATEVFVSSPLYRSFCATVADAPDVLALLQHRRPGQQPSYLLFGAVQYLLLAGAEHPLAGIYAGARRGDPVPSRSGDVLLDFIGSHRDGLLELLRTRLVQTNVARRAVGLRYALSVIAPQCTGPAHLVEVGASAGILLNVERYRYVFGDLVVGDADSPVTISTQLRAGPAVDLRATPDIASATGVDLQPVDLRDSDRRRWLQALVWPENRADAELLAATLEFTAANPPTVLAGDALDVLPHLAGRLPVGQPRIVFHAATRMHVAPHRWPAFDAAIDALGETGPLFHLWQESPEVTHGAGPAVDRRAGLLFHGPDGLIRPIAAIDGHGAWLHPLRLG